MPGRSVLGSELICIILYYIVEYMWLNMLIHTYHPASADKSEGCLAGVAVCGRGANTREWLFVGGAQT